MSVEMHLSQEKFIIFFILWSQYDPCGCLQDKQPENRGTTMTKLSNSSDQNDSVIVLRAAGSGQTYNVRLTNLKEIRLQDGSSFLKIYEASSDTVKDNPESLPTGLYYLNNPGNGTTALSMSSPIHTAKTELNESQNVIMNGQNEGGNLTELRTDSEVLDDWNIRDDTDIPDLPRQYYESWPVELNVTNCTSYSYGNEVTVNCHDVVINEVGPILPANTTILTIDKCYGTNTLGAPALSHMTNLRLLQLYNCRIRYMKTAFFQGFGNLRKLKLNLNAIAVFGKNIFSSTPNITELNLASNNIMWLRSLSVAVKDLRYLSKLYLDHNKLLKKILSTDFEYLENSTIDTLTLSDCDLKFVEEGAFMNMKNLKSLILSVNRLERDALLNITKSLVSTKIEYLELQEMTGLFRGEGFITKELQPLANTQLVTLDLDSNYIVRLNEANFPNLTTLKKLSMNNCYLDFIHPQAFVNLVQLEQLFLKRNRLISLTFQIPSLRAIDLSYNRDLSVGPTQFQISDSQIKSFPKLYVFKLVESTYVGPITRNTFSGMYSLKKLYIEFTSLSNISDYAFQNLNDLRHLYLSSNSIKRLSGRTFIGLHKLTRLNIDNNFVSYFSDGEVFNPLVSLEVLSMRRNQLKHLPANLFSFNEKLEIIWLNQNLIPTWKNEIFSTNNSLRALLLDNNVIQDVSPVMLTAFKKLEVLDLSMNVFDCNTCNMKRFQDWILNSGNTSVRNFQDKPDTYICTFPNSDNVSLANASIPESLCWPEVDNTLAVVVICVCTCAVFILGFSLILYKLRWYARYAMFSLRSQMKRFRELKNQKEYAFDAFVSYSSADVSWVAEELVPYLEGPECKFRLCLHDRDFMGGVPITDNILASIDSSRKTVMVLTEDYVKSNWCMFELHMAQHRLFEDTRDALVLIQLRSVEKIKLPSQLKYLMKTRTYIPWITSDQSAVGNRLFWKKLADALKPVEQQQTFNRII